MRELTLVVFSLKFQLIYGLNSCCVIPSNAKADAMKIEFLFFSPRRFQFDLFF